MGSSGSKAARTAAASATRKYPSRATGELPVTNPTSSPASTQGSTQSAQAIPPREDQPGPTVHTKAQASDHRTEAIDLDARDPHFAGRLSELGPVKPYPTFSPSSTSSPQPDASSGAAASVFGHGNFPAPSSNPAVATLAARARIQEAVEQEKINAGRAGFEGRQYVDIATLRKVLVLRDEQGMRPEEIEKALRLKTGVVKGLGRVGVVEAA